VLALDEPTAGLDPQGRLELLRILRQWGKDGDRAIILASHNMEDLAELATRVYVLVAGQVVLEGPPEQVFERTDVLVPAGLSVPPAVEVIQELRRRGFTVPHAVLTPAQAIRQIEAILHA